MSARLEDECPGGVPPLGNRPMVLVAAVALVDPDGRVLIAQRPEGKSMAGLWEFPGGKCEPGETHEECLRRELIEELGVDKAPAFFEAVLDHADRRFQPCIARLAHGTWRAEERIDNDCFEPIDGKIVVALTVENGKLIVDNAPLENYWDRKIPLFAAGSIQLQTHGGEMRWKNIFIREIPAGGN